MRQNIQALEQYLAGVRDAIKELIATMNVERARPTLSRQKQ